MERGGKLGTGSKENPFSSLKTARTWRDGHGGLAGEIAEKKSKDMGKNLYEYQGKGAPLDGAWQTRGRTGKNGRGESVGREKVDHLAVGGYVPEPVH